MVAPYYEPCVRGSYLGPGPGADNRNGRLVLQEGPDDFWQPQWKSKHINWLDLQAVWLTLQHFLSQLRGRVVEVLSDNMTTVSYINKQGGTHSLLLRKTSPGLVGLVRSAPDHHIRGASGRGEQHPHGRAVERQLLPDGMDPPQTDFPFWY